MHRFFFLLALLSACSSSGSTDATAGNRDRFCKRQEACALFDPSDSLAKCQARSDGVSAACLSCLEGTACDEVKKGACLGACQ